MRQLFCLFSFVNGILAGIAKDNAENNTIVTVTMTVEKKDENEAGIGAETKKEIEAKKIASRAKAAVKKAETSAKAAAKKPAAKARAAKLDLVFQSPMGGAITPDEIVKKLPKGAKKAYVRIDENKIYWVNGDETGSVDIW